MYNQATCQVKWKGSVGAKIDSRYGVLQGRMASPFLFSEFLYDLKDFLYKEYGAVLGEKLLTYLLFADDLVLCVESAADLQKTFNGLEQFYKTWHLIVSLTKTKIMVFNKKIVTEIFIYNGNEVEIVNQYKYLGTIFSSDTVPVEPGLKKALFVFNAHVNNSKTILEPYVAFNMFECSYKSNSSIWSRDMV